MLAAASLALAAAFSAPAQDAASVLRRSAAEMGADGLDSLRYSGSGTGASFGQAFRPDTRWPRLKISRFSRDIDYTAPAMVEDMTRSRAEKQGGGAVPIAGEGRAVAAVSGAFAWNVQ